MFFILWVMSCGWHIIYCGYRGGYTVEDNHVTHSIYNCCYPQYTFHSICRPQYILHSIYQCYPQYIRMRPQYIIPPLGYTVDAVSHLGYMLWVTLLYTVVVSILCIYCGLHIYCGVHAVGNMGIYCGWHLYTVEICCGVHFFLLYTVGYIYCGLRVVHSIYRVVHSIYILWSICCGCTHVLPMLY